MDNTRVGIAEAEEHAYIDGRNEGRQDERNRLLPLLEECLLEILRVEKAEGPDAPYNQNRVDLVAALRAELGKEG